MSGPATPSVVCLVGTDHHPFDRLVHWCDALATSHPDVDVFVQYGRSRPPTVARGRAFLDKDDLVATLARAHVAISHGGPGLISEVRAAGLYPLVVPRDPERGEHVDGHQMRFVARVAASGVVTAVATERDLLSHVAGQLGSARGGDVNPSADAARVAASVDRFSVLVDGLLHQRR